MWRKVVSPVSLPEQSSTLLFLLLHGSGCYMLYKAVQSYMLASAVRFEHAQYGPQHSHSSYKKPYSDNSYIQCFICYILYDCIAVLIEHIKG